MRESERERESIEGEKKAKVSERKKIKNRTLADRWQVKNVSAADKTFEPPLKCETIHFFRFNDRLQKSWISDKFSNFYLLFPEK